MKNFKKNVFQVFGLTLFFASAAFAQQQVQRTPFDVKNYVMDVQLVPGENRLNATVDVNFVPLADTRSVSFELNGSLKIESVERQNAFAQPITTAQPKTRNPKPAVPTTQNQVTFIQD